MCCIYHQKYLVSSPFDVSSGRWPYGLPNGRQRPVVTIRARNQNASTFILRDIYITTASFIKDSLNAEAVSLKVVSF